MKNKIRITVLKSFLFLLLVASNSLHASMLISPTRAAINDRERSAEIILINNGDKTKTYRLGWKQQRALPEGGYEELDELQSKNFATASNMLRFSPRQVTLKPNERQIVKLGVRRPKDLPDGEYRSHLLFMALPTEDKVEQSSGAAGVQLKLLLNYSIPVFVRKGKLNYDVVINEAHIDRKEKADGTQYKIVVAFERSGIHGTYGSIQAYWTPNNSKEEIKVGTLNGVNLFAELKTITREVTWQPTTPPTSGKLRIAYEGGQEFSGKVLAEKVIEL
jgi:fimbrial chaperone protein